MKKDKIIKLLKNLVPYIIIVILVVLLRTFIITPAMVNGDSMEPTLSNNNIVLLNKLNYKIDDINRFDVVVIKYKNEKLIKRVIGLPGEHISFQDNRLYVNGFVEIEEFEHSETSDFNLELLGYLNIPGDKYFVIGDNRENSVDSRTFGLVNKEDILGYVSTRIFPLNKIGRIK